jgi:predicted enzyme related to lactoylglutathione lyase
MQCLGAPGLPLEARPRLGYVGVNDVDATADRIKELGGKRTRHQLQVAADHLDLR